MSKQAGMGCARGLLCSLHNGLLVTECRRRTSGYRLDIEMLVGGNLGAICERELSGFGTGAGSLLRPARGPGHAAFEPGPGAAVLFIFCQRLARFTVQ